jgi:hypothetical protein
MPLIPYARYMPCPYAATFNYETTFQQFTESYEAGSKKLAQAAAPLTYIREVIFRNLVRGTYN